MWRVEKQVCYPDLIWDDTPDGKQHKIAEVYQSDVADQIVANHNEVWQELHWWHIIRGTSQARDATVDTCEMCEGARDMIAQRQALAAGTAAGGAEGDER